MRNKRTAGAVFCGLMLAQLAACADGEPQTVPITREKVMTCQSVQGMATEEEETTVRGTATEEERTTVRGTATEEERTTVQATITGERTSVQTEAAGDSAFGETQDYRCRELDYGELISVLIALQSQEGWEDWLSGELTDEDYYLMDEEGEWKRNRFSIRLPQFSESLPGYSRMNAFFQEVYGEAEAAKKEFFGELESLGESVSEAGNFYSSIYYNYIYVGEHYVMISWLHRGYRGGLREFFVPYTVIFDKETGEASEWRDLFQASDEEILCRLLWPVLKYIAGEDRFPFSGASMELLLEVYDPERMWIMDDGIGLYFPRYSIGSGAAGDAMFVVSYEELEDIMLCRP